MSDLRIDSLRLGFEDVDGQLHRIRPICRRAAALLAELVAQRPLPGSVGGTRIERMDAHVEVDLTHMSDEEASRRLAEGVYQALAGGLGPAERGALPVGGRVTQRAIDLEVRRGEEGGRVHSRPA